MYGINGKRLNAIKRFYSRVNGKLDELFGIKTGKDVSCERVFYVAMVV